MTSLDKLLYEASQGLFPKIEGATNLDEQIDGVTLVKDVDGKIKVSDNFVGNGGAINLPIDISDVTDLQDKLDEKALTAHKHEISDVNDLQVELDKKALKTDFNNLKTNFDSHKHEISQINNLQPSLDQKAPLTHTHNWAEIVGRPTTSPTQIDKLADDSHTHPNMNVINNLEDGNGILIYNGNPLGETAYLSVQNITERDAIPMEARKEGLMVLVLEDGGMYYLKNGTDNAFWQIFSKSAGGAVTASTLPATPPNGLVGVDTQALLDELAVKKANQADVYTKAETENFVQNFPVDYYTLDNLPDLSTLHNHDNKATLDLFNQYQGDLTWNGKTLGDLVTEIYDADKNLIVDKAQTLEGLVTTIVELNHVSGATSNLQSQINSLSSGVTFRGEYPTYADMIAGLTSPSKGDLVYIKTDETKDNAIDTQYVYDGIDFIYGGGTTKTPDATLTTKGVIQLGGDLAGANSTAQAPKLTPTGVNAGLYKNASLTISEDGRVTHAEEGNQVFLNDAIVSVDEGWSSQKVNDELAKKAERNHTHAQLHDANMIGKIRIDETVLPSTNYVPTYDPISGQAKWASQQGGRVSVGSKYIDGSWSLVGGSYINLLIDEQNKSITINSTYRDNGGVGVQSGIELTFSQFVEAGKSVRLSVDTGYNKVMLHTLQMFSDMDSVGEIRIYNQSINGNVEYNSNQEMVVSDIVNVPMFDNDNSKKMHFEIDNKSINDSTFSVRCKLTNLL